MLDFHSIIMRHSFWTLIVGAAISTPAPRFTFINPGNVSLTLQRRNMDTSVGRCEETGCVPYEMSATDT